MNEQIGLRMEILHETFHRISRYRIVVNENVTEKGENMKSKRRIILWIVIILGDLPCSHRR